MLDSKGPNDKMEQFMKDFEKVFYWFFILPHIISHNTISMRRYDYFANKISSIIILISTLIAKHNFVVFVIIFINV